MSRIFVKPGEGRAIKKADRSWVPAEGEFLEHDTFVERRLRTGDLLLADPPVEKPAPATKATPAPAVAASSTEGKAP